MLGVYLGKEGYQEKNWEGMIDKVCAKLSKWKWVLPKLSYRGRALVVNNLVASMIFFFGLDTTGQKLLCSFYQFVKVDMD